MSVSVLQGSEGPDALTIPCQEDVMQCPAQMMVYVHKDLQVSTLTVSANLDTQDQTVKKVCAYNMTDFICLHIDLILCSCTEYAHLTIATFGDPDESYLQISRDDTTIRNIVLVLKMCTSSGLIFMASDQIDGCIEYTSLHLSNGHLQLSAEIGGSTENVTSQQSIPLCEWINVTIR
jgi:hypothetical protein